MCGRYPCTVATRPMRDAILQSLMRDDNGKVFLGLVVGSTGRGAGGGLLDFSLSDSVAHSVRHSHAASCVASANGARLCVVALKKAPRDLAMSSWRSARRHSNPRRMCPRVTQEYIYDQKKPSSAKPATRAGKKTQPPRARPGPGRHRAARAIRPRPKVLLRRARQTKSHSPRRCRRMRRKHPNTAMRMPSCPLQVRPSQYPP